MKEWDEEKACREQEAFIAKYQKKARTARANVFAGFEKLDREDQLEVIRGLAARLKHR